MINALDFYDLNAELRLIILLVPRCNHLFY